MAEVKRLTGPLGGGRNRDVDLLGGLTPENQWDPYWLAASKAEDVMNRSKQRDPREEIRTLLGIHPLGSQARAATEQYAQGTQSVRPFGSNLWAPPEELAAYQQAGLMGGGIPTYQPISPDYGTPMPKADPNYDPNALANFYGEQARMADKLPVGNLGGTAADPTGITGDLGGVAWNRGTPDLPPHLQRTVTAASPFEAGPNPYQRNWMGLDESDIAGMTDAPPTTPAGRRATRKGGSFKPYQSTVKAPNPWTPMSQTWAGKVTGGPVGMGMPNPPDAPTPPPRRGKTWADKVETPWQRYGGPY